MYVVVAWDKTRCTTWVNKVRPPAHAYPTCVVRGRHRRGRTTQRPRRKRCERGSLRLGTGPRLDHESFKAPSRPLFISKRRGDSVFDIIFKIWKRSEDRERMSSVTMSKTTSRKAAAPPSLQVVPILPAATPVQRRTTKKARASVSLVQSVRDVVQAFELEYAQVRAPPLSEPTGRTSPSVWRERDVRFGNYLLSFTRGDKNRLP